MPKPVPASVDDPWQQNLGTIRQFIERHDDYKQLCDEVVYILRAQLKSRGIETASISARAKNLDSFLEKIRRKTYSLPFDEITDFAGARVVCLYKNDLQVIEEIIRTEFEVIEKVDKLNDKNVDQFGYGAIHFLVRLGKKSSGARYDDLKSLVCEIQTRTVVQDAWAIIQHHLVYKHESEVPAVIQRKLNSLAGLFEIADNEYQQIRQERDAYVDGIRQSTSQPVQFLQYDVNLDSLREYLQWKFPDRPLESFPGQLALIFGDIGSSPYKTLNDLEKDINASKKQRLAIAKELSHDLVNTGGKAPATLEFLWASALTSPNVRKFRRMPHDWRKAIERQVSN